MFFFLSIKLYFIIVHCLCSLLLITNIFLGKRDVYAEKTGPFECGFTSFQQSRIALTVSFILIAIIFLPFYLEVSTVLPYCAEISSLEHYGV